MGLAYFPSACLHFYTFSPCSSPTTQFSRDDGSNQKLPPGPYPNLPIIGTKKIITGVR